MKRPKFDESWSAEVIRVYEHDLDEIWDSSRARHMYNKCKYHLSLYNKIAQNLKPRHILDVGCAQATLAITLAEQGYHVTANDIRSEFLEYAKSRYEKGDIKFVHGNIFEINIGDTFDLIYANQIIEHLVHPVNFISSLSRLLKPGGAIVLTTPNHDYVKNSLPSFDELGDATQYEHLQFTADADGHFFSYTAKELERIIREAGMEVKRTFTFESPIISGHMKIRFLHSVLPYSALSFGNFVAERLPFIGRRLCHQLGILATID
jgi:2-polyprenyl-3-methyl-5-hydroxy-6-metoxy-1,4-benzoquinol methylase